MAASTMPPAAYFHIAVVGMPRSMPAGDDSGWIALRGMPAWHPQDAAGADAVPAMHRGYIRAAARHGGMPAVHRALQCEQPAHQMRCAGIKIRPWFLQALCVVHCRPYAGSYLPLAIRRCSLRRSQPWR